MQYRQPCAVVAVGVGAQLVFHHVGLEISLLVQLDDTIFCHGGFPHQVAPGGVVLWIFYRRPQITDHAPHQSFRDVIRNIFLVGGAEIDFHDVAKGVKAARNHLRFRDTEGIGGVHQGEFGVALGVVPASLDFQRLVGNNRPAIAFAACSGYGDHHTQGQRLVTNDSGPGPKILPNVSVIGGCQRDRLAAVHDTAAAHGQDHVHMVLPGQSRAFQHLGIGGVRHDTRELHHLFFRRSERTHDLLIDAVSLDGAAAIGQHYRLAVLLQ